MNGFPILSIMLLVPAVAAVACLFLSPHTARWTALAATLIDLALGVLLWASFDVGGAQWQFQEYAPVFGSFSWALGIDGFALLLIANEIVRMIWGSQPIMLNTPPSLSGPVELFTGMTYPAYRLLVIGIGLVVALVLYLLVTRTRAGMLVRAGASNREMAMAMGVNVSGLFTAVFAVGAVLSALAMLYAGHVVVLEPGQRWAGSWRLIAR